MNNFSQKMFSFVKNKLNVTKQLLKTSFAFILTIKMNKSKLNFPSEVNVKAAKLSLKVHSVVSEEGKLFTFALRPAVI